VPEIVAFAEPHVDHFVTLCEAEGWPSWTGSRVLGRALMAELFARSVFARSGLERIDLLSTEEALPFYASLSHRRKPGVRIYA
jgi:hypothetical protein